MNIPVLSTKPLYPSYSEQLLEIIAGIQAVSNKDFQTDVIEFIRPADTTPYTIGDVISDNSLLSLNLGFTGIFRIKSLAIMTNNITWSGKKIRVYLFDKAISAYNDNIAYGIYYALFDYCMGFVDLTINSEVAGDCCYGILNELNLIGDTDNNLIYFVPVIKDAVTPLNGQRFKIRLETEIPSYLF